jgi:hypothetical protein
MADTEQTTRALLLKQINNVLCSSVRIDHEIMELEARREALRIETLKMDNLLKQPSSLHYLHRKHYSKATKNNNGNTGGKNGNNKSNNHNDNDNANNKEKKRRNNNDNDDMMKNKNAKLSFPSSTLNKMNKMNQLQSTNRGYKNNNMHVNESNIQHNSTSKTRMQATLATKNINATNTSSTPIQDVDSIEDSIVCSVCNNGDNEENNLIVICEKCNLPVHQACYGIKKIPEGDWLCSACHHNLSYNSRTCVLCPLGMGALKPTTEKGNWAHVLCGTYITRQNISLYIFYSCM